MGKETGIQWCDSTVNPTTGCDGCELWHVTRKGSCYAGNFHEQRLSRSLPGLYAADFTEVRLAPGRMIKAAAASDLTGKDRPDKPWLDGRPRTIFVSDMSDAMSRSVHFLYLKEEIIDVVTSPKGRRHVWMWLSKRPDRMAKFAASLKDEFGIGWPENLWPGTSITGKASLSRIDHLIKVPSRRRFLSVEPLVESVDLSPWLFCERCESDYTLCGRGAYETPLDNAAGGCWFRECRCSPLSLIIVGGESGSRARPFDIQWARSIRDQCKDAGIPYFLKQIGAKPIESEPSAWPNGYPNGDRSTSLSGDGFGTYLVQGLKDSHGGNPDEWPDDIRVRQFPRVVKPKTEVIR